VEASAAVKWMKSKKRQSTTLIATTAITDNVDDEDGDHEDGDKGT